MAVDRCGVDTSSPMGATVRAGGTVFRTWAPNAISVAVVADGRLDDHPIDAWHPGPDDALAPLGDGTWGGWLAGVGEGQSYMVFIEGLGSSGWKRDPYARELTRAAHVSETLCVVRDPSTYPWHDSGWTPPRYEDLVVYQLHVGTWRAQDEAGHDARETRSGTFLDVAAGLGYLRDLGVNALQLLPIQEFETTSSLGYNGIDYFSPETDYVVAPEDLAWRLSGLNATLAALGQPGLTQTQLAPAVNQLKCLVDLCHLHGIAVIFDLVYNHAGGGFDDHSQWFYDRQSTVDKANSLYFIDAEWAGGQVFAYGTVQVAQYLIDNAVFFLEEYRIDGIRYDEVRVIENNGGADVCRHLTETVRFVRPGAIQIAEYWNPDRAFAVRPTPSGLGFDAELGDDLRDALRGLLEQLAGGASSPVDLSAVASALVTPSVYDAGWRLNQCLENQDKVYADHPDAARVAALADPSDANAWYARSRTRAVTVLLMTAPGIPALFMGQEFLETKKWSDDRQKGDQIDWDSLSANPVRRDFLRFFTDLVWLRRLVPALRSNGARVSRAQNFERVIVLHRWVEGEGRDVVIVVGFDESPKHDYTIGLPFAGRWREAFNSDVYDGFPNGAPIGNGGAVWAIAAPLDGFAASAVISLPANGALVLTRD